MQHNVSEFDFIFLSYDEPNAEELFADLINKVPWAKRVHGIKGFDNAHKMCASKSETDFFITVDGDNLVHDDFLTVHVDIDETMQSHAWTWSGKNIINDLIYGNGGLKLWSKKFVNSMNSHENATAPSDAVDFCWNNNYCDLPGCYSTTVTNSTPYQAFRGGFREGVKMGLDRGVKVSNSEFINRVYYGNLQKLSVWCSIGKDVQNGEWAIYGARLGAYMCNLTDWDYTIISDYDWFNEFWNTVSTCNPVTESVKLGADLTKMLGMTIADLDGQQSKFFKTFYTSATKARE